MEKFDNFWLLIVLFLMTMIQLCQIDNLEKRIEKMNVQIKLENQDQDYHINTNAHQNTKQYLMLHKQEKILKSHSDSILDLYKSDFKIQKNNVMIFQKFINEQLDAEFEPKPNSEWQASFNQMLQNAPTYDNITTDHVGVFDTEEGFRIVCGNYTRGDGRKTLFVLGRRKAGEIKFVTFEIMAVCRFIMEMSGQSSLSAESTEISPNGNIIMSFSLEK